jgi:hypothetical protein
MRRLKERSDDRDKAISPLAFRAQLKAIHARAKQEPSDLSGFDGDPRIGVPVPDPTDAVAALDDQVVRHARLVELDRCSDPGEPGADHHHLVVRHFRSVHALSVFVSRPLHIVPSRSRYLASHSAACAVAPKCCTPCSCSCIVRKIDRHIPLRKHQRTGEGPLRSSARSLRVYSSADPHNI